MINPQWLELICMVPRLFEPLRFDCNKKDDPEMPQSQTKVYKGHQESERAKGDGCYIRNKTTKTKATSSVPQRGDYIARQYPTNTTAIHQTHPKIKKRYIRTLKLDLKVNEYIEARS